MRDEVLGPQFSTSSAWAAQDGAEAARAPLGSALDSQHERSGFSQVQRPSLFAPRVQSCQHPGFSSCERWPEVVPR